MLLDGAAETVFGLDADMSLGLFAVQGRAAVLNLRLAVETTRILAGDMIWVPVVDQTFGRFARYILRSCVACTIVSRPSDSDSRRPVDCGCSPSLLEPRAAGSKGRDSLLSSDIIS